MATEKGGGKMIEMREKGPVWELGNIWEYYSIKTVGLYIG